MNIEKHNSMKTYYLPTKELENMYKLKGLIYLECPCCETLTQLTLSSDEMLDIVSTNVEAICPICSNLFNISWDDEDMFYEIC